MGAGTRPKCRLEGPLPPFVGAGPPTMSGGARGRKPRIIGGGSALTLHHPVALHQFRTLCTFVTQKGTRFNNRSFIFSKSMRFVAAYL